MSHRGIYYIATGKDFVREAELSARYVREAMPDIEIAIATDSETNFRFDYVINITDAERGFVDQIDNMYKSPFDETIHFDTDIYVSSNIFDMFELLERFNMAVAYNHNREAYNLPGIPDSFPEFNTGVIVYKKNHKTQRFFKDWKINYNKLITEKCIQNQPSFRKTLFESDIRIAPLTPEYNCMVRYPGHVKNKVMIGHSRLIDIETPGAKTVIDVIGSVRELNMYSGHRIYVPYESGVVLKSGHNPNIFERIVNSIKGRGFTTTAKRCALFAIGWLKGRSNQL